MLKAKHFFALLVVAAAAVLFAAYSLQETASIPRSGDSVYPQLLERIPDVAKVEIVSEGQSFTLDNTGDGRWQAPQRGGFALDADKVHQLLVGAAGLTRIEPKTAKPELYPQLGVEDPSSPEAASIRYTLRSGAGEVMADLIVGEGKPAKGDPSSSEYFVREAGQAQSWLVKGTLPSGVETLADWLDSRIATISPERTRVVELTHPDGEVVSVSRSEPGSGDFRFDQEPAERKVKDVWRVNDMGRVLADLELDEVRSAAEAAAIFGPETRKVEVRTFDGLVVRMDVIEVGEQEHLARLSASFDAAAAEDGAALESEALKDAQTVEKEAESLNERWQPWVYQIPKYKSDYVNKRPDDLLPDAEPEPAGSGDKPAAGS